MSAQLLKNTVPGVKVLAPVTAEQAEILSPEALQFVATLQRAYNKKRLELLNAREVYQALLDDGKVLPTFPAETAHIRNDPSWRGAAPAPALIDRRVEITGPVDKASMVINALNSGACTYMADFEDSTSPTWFNVVQGQVNMRNAVHRTLQHTNPKTGKQYKLNSKVATLIVRPRGWHLEEKHVLVDGQPMSGSLFDFGLYFFHNAKKAMANGFGPYFYLPKMEHYLEARLWNNVFITGQDYIGIPRGTIRGTVLIETILAAYQMEEIIYELREHSSGLNCGRWDYIFSVIKKFRHNPAFILPDRDDVTMTVPFMDAYVRKLIQTCHKRGVFAMGGMAATVPIKNDAAANARAMDKVRADKLREVTAGHDGTWVAHPALVPIALKVFEEHLKGQLNQMHVLREDVNVSEQDLINTRIVGSKISDHGVVNNIFIVLTYMEAWLRGVGCVPIHNLMEDAATAEISRSQLWQWVRHGVKTDSGRVVDAAYLKTALDAECAKEKQRLGDAQYNKMKYEEAKRLLATQITGGDDYADFLTTLCYDSITSIPSKANL